MVPRPFRVARVAKETADVWTLVLEPQGGAPPAIAAGQFMMVYAFGVGEVPISVSGPADHPGPVVLTVRSVGAVSRAICAAKPGGTLGLRGPFGSSWPVAAAAGGDVVVVAGGIGLAPLRPVVLELLEAPERYGSISVLYGARTPADLLFLDELDRWRAGGIEVEVTVDAAASGWDGRVGVVPKLVATARFEAQAATAFVCGPEIMMRFTVEALLGRGVPPGSINVSLERRMECAVGLCGHCQLGPTLVCRDGAVYRYEQAAPLMAVREL